MNMENELLKNEFALLNWGQSNLSEHMYMENGVKMKTGGACISFLPGPTLKVYEYIKFLITFKLFIS